MHERSKIPCCEECAAYEENPKEYVDKEICPFCCWSVEIHEPIIYKLIEYLSLQDAGCPIQRHELVDREWQWLGTLKREREKITHEEVKKNGDIGKFK